LLIKSSSIIQRNYRIKILIFMTFLLIDLSFESHFQCTSLLRHETKI
jgi:hypothetical protein